MYYLLWHIFFVPFSSGNWLLQAVAPMHWANECSRNPPSNLIYPSWQPFSLTITVSRFTEIPLQHRYRSSRPKTFFHECYREKAHYSSMVETVYQIFSQLISPEIHGPTLTTNDRFKGLMVQFARQSDHIPCSDFCQFYTKELKVSLNIQFNIDYILIIQKTNILNTFTPELRNFVILQLVKTIQPCQTWPWFVC